MSSEFQSVDLTIVKTEPDGMETSPSVPEQDVVTENHSSTQPEVVGETPQAGPLTEDVNRNKDTETVGTDGNDIETESTPGNNTENSTNTTHSLESDTDVKPDAKDIVLDTTVGSDGKVGTENGPNATDTILSLKRTDDGSDVKPDQKGTVMDVTPAGDGKVSGDRVAGDGEDDECVLMEYRSATNMATVTVTSDSSADSSSSDSEVEETTDAKLNKALSHERDASPDGEKRVKLNRHGFEDIRTKGEILPEELPPLEELTITVDETVKMEEIGSIKSIVGVLVVIASNGNISPLDDDSILFVDGHKVLGQVFETFGPVKAPWYSVRFNDAENITSKGLSVGMPVYCAPNEESFTKYVFVNALKELKGSDASWDDNNEPPEKYLDYSDDEQERMAKTKRKNKNKKDREQTGGQESCPEKRGRNTQRWPQTDGQEIGRNTQCWPPREQRSANDQQGSWAPRNPFQGSNRPSNRLPFDGRPYQGNGPRGPPRGPPWNRNQTRFNGPPSRFSGPPNFQGRPNFNNQQFPQHFQMGNGHPGNNTHSERGHSPNMGGNSGQTYNNGPSMRVNLQSPPPPVFGSSVHNRHCTQPSNGTNGHSLPFGSQGAVPNTAVPPPCVAPPPAFGSNVRPPINQQCNAPPSFPTNQQQPFMENRVNSSTFANSQSRPPLLNNVNGGSQFGSQTSPATGANMNNPSFQSVSNTGMQSVSMPPAPPKQYQVHALNPTNSGPTDNQNSNPQRYEQIQVSAPAGPYRPVAQQQGNYPNMQQGTSQQSGALPYRGSTHPYSTQTPTFTDNRVPAQNTSVNCQSQNYQDRNNRNHHNQQNTGEKYGSTAYGTIHGQGDYWGQNNSGNVGQGDYHGQNNTENVGHGDYRGQNNTVNVGQGDYRGQNNTGNVGQGDYHGQNNTGNVGHGDYRGQNNTGNVGQGDYRGQNNTVNVGQGNSRGQNNTGNVVLDPRYIQNS